MSINKILINLSLYSLLVFSSDVMSKTDFKCHVNTSEGDKILFYHWDNKSVTKKAAMLTGKAQKGKKGKKFYIKNATQCIPLSETFKEKDAQILDKQTAR